MSSAPERHRILVISGSVGEPSRTRTLARVVTAVLKLKGALPTFWDLAERVLPIANPTYHYAPEENPDETSRELARRAEEAEAFVLATPVYHNSYSGVLKNCLDHLAIRHFEGKPVGLVAHGGALRSLQASDHLRIVIRGLHGISIVTQVVTADSDYVVEGGQIKLANQMVVDRVNDFASELLFYTDQQHRLEAEPLPLPVRLRSTSELGDAQPLD
jgi:azobenzene reductase